MEKKNHEFSCFKWRYIKGLRVTVWPLHLHCCLLLIPRSRSMKSFETYEGQHSNLIFFSHKMFILMRLERTSNQSFLGNMTTFAFLQLLNYFLLLIDQILTFTVKLLSQIEIKWNLSKGLLSHSLIHAQRLRRYLPDLKGWPKTNLD